MGRQSKYSEEVVDHICKRIATSSDGLHKICEDEGMPTVMTVFNWLNKDEYKAFLYKYARAREAQAELLADEIISIADESTRDTLFTEDGKEYSNSEWINRSRLRVDARKWKASKLYPKKFGDRMELDMPNNIIKVVIQDDGDTPSADTQDNQPEL